MHKNPKHRPANELRIKSMLRHYLAAFETFIVRDNELFNELYGGKDFPISKRNLSERDKLNLAIDELNLVFKYILLDWRESTSGEHGLVVDWRETLSDNQDLVLDWHELHSNVFEPLSIKPRGDKMQVYKIAAATFNNQLTIDQAGSELLGKKPSRLKEKPITPSALQRQISRTQPETLQNHFVQWE